MLRAIHLKTRDLTSELTTRLIEATIVGVTGVAKVVVVKSLGIVSVMFDDTRASVEQILRTMRAAGFDASVLSGA